MYFQTPIFEKKTPIFKKATHLDFKNRKLRWPLKASTMTELLRKNEFAKLINKESQARGDSDSHNY